VQVQSASPIKELKARRSGVSGVATLFRFGWLLPFEKQRRDTVKNEDRNNQDNYYLCVNFTA
jgi:hypothetical protein